MENFEKASKQKVSAINLSSCAICGAENVGLLYATHKEHGKIGVCQQCWQQTWSGNVFLSNVTCTSSACGARSSCSGCN